MNRRKFLTFLAAAPAIVSASSLMPIKQMWWTPSHDLYVGPGRPWQTLQAAMDYLANDLPLCDALVTINIDAGTYAGCKIPPLTASLINFKGAGSGQTLIYGSPWAIHGFDVRRSVIELNDVTIGTR